MRRLACCAIIALCLTPALIEAKAPKKAVRTLALLRQLGVGPLVVKDGRGNTVGTAIGPEITTDPTVVGVLRNVNQLPVVFFVNAAGFAPASNWTLSYASGDCTGPPRLAPDIATSGMLLYGVAQIIAGTAYFATGPIADTVVGSTEVAIDPEASPCAGTVTARGGCCFPAVGLIEPEAAATSLDLSTLGLVPPFHVEGP